MKTGSKLKKCWKHSGVSSLVSGRAITLAGCFAGALWAIACSGDYALGQVVGDNTLGANNSQVTSPNLTTFQINGGATRGTNLFHSFSQFDIPTGGTASFNNAANIRNIISRVTGGTASNIDGLITANGTVNLFLINPNGISFGPKAKLNIDGSFMASTASSVLFANGTQFSAKETQTQPLLTVSVPIGLQLGNNPAPVTVQGSNLEVKPNQNLVLLGGAVGLDKATLTAPGGRIELGGLSAAGTVGVNENGSLNFPAQVALSDMSMTNGTAVKVRAGGGGFITINAHNLAVSGKSELTVGIGKDLGPSQAQAGDVEINASGTVSLDESQVKNQVEQKAQGNAGNIKITTGSLFLSNNAEVNAGTFGVGNAGSVIIKASDRISMINNGQLQSRVNENAVGNSGGIDITTGNLFLKFSGMSATTEGRGNSGPVIIKASGDVVIERSDVRSRVREKGVGNSSGIYISADSLSITKGTELNASTLGEGNSGRVVLQANNISIRNSEIKSRVGEKAVGNSGGIDITAGNLSINGGLTATTEGKGNAGLISLKASGNISIDRSFVSSRVDKKGVGDSAGIYISADSLSLTNEAELNAGTFGVGNAGPVIIKANGSISLMDDSFVSSRVENTGKGNSGGIYISANSLFLTNKADVNVSSFGQGNPGNLEITTNSLRLDNGSTISADTKGGQGNIHLNSVDLVLRHGSNITTNATGSNIIGGNITINTGVLAAVENSDISANSHDFRGGNVTITTQGIFGTKFQPQLTPESDITATGVNSSLNGTVTINTPDVDPSRGLANLPVEPVNPVEVAQGCQSGEKQASIEFFNTGRGGLAPNPYEPMSSSGIWEDIPPPAQRTANSASAAHASASPTTSPHKIVEAQGWLINEKGQVDLVAQMPTPHSQSRCRLR
jgi:filamentous hemagglutinin family protein